MGEAVVERDRRGADVLHHAGCSPSSASVRRRARSRAWQRPRLQPPHIILEGRTLSRIPNIIPKPSCEPHIGPPR
jgi:hypothetical protein